MTARLFTLPKQSPLSNTGALIPGAKAYFYLNGTSTLQDTYTTSDLNVSHTNPVIADGDGKFPAIYLDDSLTYKVKITDASDVEIYTEDDFLDAPAETWPQTAAELAAGVTPTNYKYQPGNVLRYGTNTTPGTTDMSAAAQSAADSNTIVLFPEGGTYLLSSVVTITDDVTITAYGATIKGGGVDSNADLFSCSVAKTVSVQGGTFQDCRYGFLFDTAFANLSVKDASFSAAAMGILINLVAAATGSVNIDNCSFDAVEIGIDLRSSPVGSVNVVNCRFTNVAYQTLTLRPSPLDKKIVSGLWYQAIAGSAGPSVCTVSNNYVNGVTGPTLAESSGGENEVHGLAVSLDNDNTTSVIMDSNYVRDTAGHSTLLIGDEGLLARARSVVVSNNILKDAGASEGCLYAKGTEYHKITGNIVEVRATNPKLSDIRGLISTSPFSDVQCNKFIGMPIGIITRAIDGNYYDNEFIGVTTSCISMRLEDGEAHVVTNIEGNYCDSDTTTFFVNETDDGSTATYGDLSLTNNRLYFKAAVAVLKAFDSVVIDSNFMQRATPTTQREIISLRANKTIDRFYFRNNVITDFQDSNTTGRVITMSANGAAAGAPRCFIENNYFGTGTLAFVTSALNYTDLVITDNKFFSTDAFSINTGVGVSGVYEVTRNINANVDTAVDTTTNLESVTALVNTSDNKVEGTMVFNSTTNKPVYAAGSADADVWVDATGATAHTPV